MENDIRKEQGESFESVIKILETFIRDILNLFERYAYVALFVVNHHYKNGEFEIIENKIIRVC